MANAFMCVLRVQIAELGDVIHQYTDLVKDMRADDEDRNNLSVSRHNKSCLATSLIESSPLARDVSSSNNSSRIE